MTFKIDIMQLPHALGLELPQYQTSASAGVDICAALSDGPVILRPKEAPKAIPTGLSIAMPVTLEAQIRSRSGLALHYGLTIVNAPGTIDADYRGEIKIIMANLGTEDFTITHGMKIAQMIFAEISRVTFQQKSHLDETERGVNGFGSTGISTQLAF